MIVWKGLQGSLSTHRSETPRGELRSRSTRPPDSFRKRSVGDAVVLRVAAAGCCGPGGRSRDPPACDARKAPEELMCDHHMGAHEFLRSPQPPEPPCTDMAELHKKWSGLAKSHELHDAKQNHGPSTLTKMAKTKKEMHNSRLTKNVKFYHYSQLFCYVKLLISFITPFESELKIFFS